jgi:hypothetical protein
MKGAFNGDFVDCARMRHVVKVSSNAVVTSKHP